ncbi:MAG: DHHW family protein [Coprococcus sp.]|nr:DHHW family protein [Coprococcus sp.]
MKRKYTKKQRQIIKKYHNLGIILFAGVMLLGAFLGLLFFARPKTSEKEKRSLAKYPSFTMKTFLNGEYFSDVSTWYSDTYPFRDALVSADQKLKGLYGIESKTMMVGEEKKADEIPDINDNTEAVTETTTAATTEAATENTEAGATTEATTEKVREVDPPDSKGMDEEIQNQIQQNLYVKGDAAYSVYYFGKENCTNYVAALNNVAAELKGQTTVYNILVPNNSGVMLSEDELSKLAGSDQEQAIDYYYSIESDDVKTVDTIKTLREHNDEYLYFRTDHHWTQLAAYYVYQNFCKVKGIEAHDLSYYDKKEFKNFLGTFYSTLGNSNMEANPDTVDAYVPKGTNDMTFWDTDGKEWNWNVIYDVDSWASSSKYMTFIGGDRPMEVIENPQIKDGSSCVVLKESYGNCFVPFLVDHYQTVYVLDYRYTTVNVLDFVKEKQADDLIIINNITIIGSTSVVDLISGLLK